MFEVDALTISFVFNLELEAGHHFYECTMFSIKKDASDVKFFANPWQKHCK